MFTQEVAPARVGGSLFNRLRIAERYKTEVFERAKSLGHDMSSDDVRAVADAVSMIRDESKTFNVFDEETLRTSFSDRAACEKLVGIGAEWDEVMTALDASVEASDPVRVLERLTTMEHLNDRYRAIVAARYAELLDRPRLRLIRDHSPCRSVVRRSFPARQGDRCHPRSDKPERGLRRPHDDASARPRQAQVLLQRAATYSARATSRPNC